MAKYNIVYTDGAKRDIVDIIDYIGTNYDSPLDAAKVAVRLFRKCESLASFPKGTPVHQINGLSLPYRFAHIKKYTIIYYIREDYSEVTIRAIVNSRRDIESILSDD